MWIYNNRVYVEHEDSHFQKDKFYTERWHYHLQMPAGKVRFAIIIYTNLWFLLDKMSILPILQDHFYIFTDISKSTRFLSRITLQRLVISNRLTVISVVLYINNAQIPQKWPHPNPYKIIPIQQSLMTTYMYFSAASFLSCFSCFCSLGTVLLSFESCWWNKMTNLKIDEMHILTKKKTSVLVLFCLLSGLN